MGLVKGLTFVGSFFAFLLEFVGKNRQKVLHNIQKLRKKFRQKSTKSFKMG